MVPLKKFMDEKPLLFQGVLITPPSPRLETVSQCENIAFRKQGRGDRVSGLPGSGPSKDSETLPKDLERPPLTVWIQGRQAYESI